MSGDGGSALSALGSLPASGLFNMFQCKSSQLQLKSEVEVEVEEYNVYLLMVADAHSLTPNLDQKLRGVYWPQLMTL
jgi:hypothetical protein